MVRKCSGGNLRQDREGPLTYGDRKKQDWYFTSQSCGSNGKRCVDGSERLLSWLGYQYVCLVRCAAVLALKSFLMGGSAGSSAEDVGEAQQGLVVLSSESFKFSRCSPTMKTITLTFRCFKASCVLVWVPIPPT